MTKKANSGKMQAVGIGVGVAALAAAAAGAYYFYGAKHSAKHRKQMKGWMIKARGEVVEQLENMKDFNRENYKAAVNQVMDKYKKLKNVEQKELAGLAEALHGHWKNLDFSSGKKVNKPAGNRIKK